MKVIGAGAGAVAQQQGEAISPSTWESGNVWNSTWDSYLYTPAGYDDNMDDYPLIIFLHGDGEKGNDPDDLLDNGLPLQIENGQQENCLVFCPQIPISQATWLASIVEAARAWCVANLRVDTNRIYITGLSLGAAGAAAYPATYPTNVAAILAVAGETSALQGSPNDYEEVALFFHHGTEDNIQNTGNSRNAYEDLGNNYPDQLVPPGIYMHYGLDHENAVWNDGVYNKATAVHDYAAWLLRHSKDRDEQAGFYVDYAEETEHLHDYLAALHLVNKLTDGAAKTALVARLATLKTTVDNGTRVIVNFGPNGAGGDVNDITSAGTGTYNSLVDTNGNDTGFSVEVADALSTVNQDKGLTGFVYGLDNPIRKEGFRVAGSRDIIFSNLNGANQYTVLVYTGRITTDWNKDEILEVTINSVEKTTSGIEYTLGKGFVEYNDIDPDGSDEITVNLDKFDRDVQIIAIVLIDQDAVSAPDSTAPTFDVSPAATNITDTSVDITATMDENGTVYVLRVDRDATQPTDSAIISGGESIVDTGSGVTVPITGLDPETDHDFWVLPVDDTIPTPNIGTAVKVQASTIAAPIVSALFNFNDSAQSISGYNDVSGNPHSGTRSATDSVTGWVVRNAGTWTSFGGGSSNATGGEDTDDGGGFAYDSDAQRTIWYHYLENDVPEIEIDNLDNAKTYTIRLLCTIDPTVASASECEQEWTIGAQSESVVARGNTSTVLEWTGVSPSSNLITLEGTDLITATGNRFFLASVLEVIEE